MSKKNRSSRTMILTRHGPSQKSRVMRNGRTPKGGWRLWSRYVLNNGAHRFARGRAIKPTVLFTFLNATHNNANGMFARLNEHIIKPMALSDCAKKRMCPRYKAKTNASTDTTSWFKKYFRLFRGRLQECL